MTEQTRARDRRDVVAIICGWKEATTIVRCDRCMTPMVEADKPLQFCVDCREWMRAGKKRRGRLGMEDAP